LTEERPTPKGASDLGGGHPSFFGRDYLLAQIFEVGIHARVVHPAQH